MEIKKWFSTPKDPDLFKVLFDEVLDLLDTVGLAFWEKKT